VTPARRFLAVGAVGLIILAGVLYLATTLDARPPTVTDYRLSHPLTGSDTTALTTTSLEVIFSEPVDTTSAERAFEIEPSVDGSVSWSGTTMVFTPSDRLPLETEFVVQVGPGVVDQHGNRASEAAPPFTFVTVGRPMVVETDPADGADGVAVDAPIAIAFSTLMDTASVEAALAISPNVPHELRWSQQVLEIVPSEPLDAGRRYEVRIAPEAADLAGTPLDEEHVLRFETVASQLEPSVVVPADGTEGIAVTTPIAMIFDQPIDPASVDAGLLTITPETAGTLELVEPEGARGMTDPDAAVLRFQPSAPLPPNTTFEVELEPGIAAVDGTQLAVPTRWTFTTGTPQPTLGNQIVFLSARSGISNLWSMNPDGTNQRQISAEVAEVVDYAVSPDARSVVVGDGARLVTLNADGAERQVLTEEGVIEFDATFSPDGRRLAFGRADAATGAGLGLWQRATGGGEAEQVPMPPELGASPDGTSPASPSPDATAEEANRLLRAPRYSPDGSALAFVDPGGRVGILELPGVRLTTVAFVAAGPPAWLPDSSAILLTGMSAPIGDALPRVTEPLPPLDPAGLDITPGELGLLDAVRLSRSGSSLQSAPIGSGAARCTVGADGAVACVRLTRAGVSGGRPILADSVGEPATTLATDPDLVAGSVTFTPEAGTLLIAAVAAPDTTESGGIWRVDGVDLNAERLAPDGRAAAWLP
jgi:hypothetical protein